MNYCTDRDNVELWNSWQQFNCISCTVEAFFSCFGVSCRADDRPHLHFHVSILHLCDRTVRICLVARVEFARNEQQLHWVSRYQSVRCPCQLPMFLIFVSKSIPVCTRSPIFELWSHFYLGPNGGLCGIYPLTISFWKHTDTETQKSGTAVVDHKC